MFENSYVDEYVHNL